MSEFISGKEALIALVNDEDVEWFDEGLNQWVFIDMSHHYNRKFRLKPQTITINGVDIDKPKLISSADCESLSIHFNNQEERNIFLNALHNRAFQNEN